MAFSEMQPWQYPPRLWALEGFPGCGKSTFAAQFKTPILVIDADHRFREILPLVEGRVYELSKDPIDHIDPNRIAAALAANMPTAKIGTIVVDSLSAILEPLIVQAMMDKETGKIKNQMAAFKTKALAMRLLQDAVTRWGSDVLWIYHLRETRDATGKEQLKTSVTDTELNRLKRSINLRLQIVEQDGQRAIKVLWARRGRSGVILPDKTGTWAGMPAKIEAAVYDGLAQGGKQSSQPARVDPRAAEPAEPAQEQTRPPAGTPLPVIQAESGKPTAHVPGDGAAPCFGDGKPVSSNPRALADFRAFEGAEGRPPTSLDELRAWIKHRA